MVDPAARIEPIVADPTAILDRRVTTDVVVGDLVIAGPRKESDGTGQVSAAIGQDAEREAIAQGIGSILSKSNTKMVVPGVDTPDVLMKILTLDPDYIQGSFVGEVQDELSIDEGTMTQIQL